MAILKHLHTDRSALTAHFVVHTVHFGELNVFLNHSGHVYKLG